MYMYISNKIHLNIDLIYLGMYCIIMIIYMYISNNCNKIHLNIDLTYLGMYCDNVHVY